MKYYININAHEFTAKKYKLALKKSLYYYTGHQNQIIRNIVFKCRYIKKKKKR